MTSDEIDIAIDRAYVEGMRAGWNRAQDLKDVPPWPDPLIRAHNAAVAAGYHAALESRRREIRAAGSGENTEERR